MGHLTRLVLSQDSELEKAFCLDLGKHGLGTNYPSGEEEMPAEVSYEEGIALVRVLPTAHLAAVTAASAALFAGVPESCRAAAGLEKLFLAAVVYQIAGAAA